MAGFKATFTCNKVLDWMYSGSTGWVPPATLYFALMTAPPTVAGGGTEATGGGYARVAVTNNTTNFPAASAASKTTGLKIDWGTFSAALGTVVGVAWYDASGAGNFIAYGPLSIPITLSAGNGFAINAGNGTITEA